MYFCRGVLSDAPLVYFIEKADVLNEKTDVV